MANIVLKRLNQKQRIEARKAAEDSIRLSVGERPNREDFEHKTLDKYPPAVIYTVLVLLAIALLMAFLISAFRMYHIGQTSAYATIANVTISRINGVAVTILAETSAIVSLVALAILPKAKKEVLYLSAFGSILLAYAGNYFVVIYGNEVTWWEWLETLLPPTLTLSLSYILKETFLELVQRRHETNILYTEALGKWELSVGNPQDHFEFQSYYADAIWDMLINVNDTGRGKTERMAILSRATHELKTRLVWREMQADNWFDSDTVQAVQSDAIEQPIEQYIEQKPVVQNTPQTASIGASASLLDVQKEVTHRSIGFVQSIQSDKSKPEQIADILRENPSLKNLSYGELLQHPLVSSITSSKGTISSAYKLLDE